MGEEIKTNVLFIAYYYPPAGGAALPGSQRTVKFIRYFQNISCHVLTLKPEYYREYIDLNFNLNLPIKAEIIHGTKNIDVFRFLLNLRSLFRKLIQKNKSTIIGQGNGTVAKKNQASVKGENSRSLFQKIKDFIYNLNYFPDDAAPWILPSLWRGYHVIRKQKIDVIFATGMPWTSLIVGYLLHKLTRKPLVVDFRDPWFGNPFHVSHGKFFDFLISSFEKHIVCNASLVSANTEPLKDDFLQRYPNLGCEKVIVLPNGYDLADFDNIPKERQVLGKLSLAHAGSLYGRRDPTPLLEAIRELCADDAQASEKFYFVQMGYIEEIYNFKHHFRYLEKNGIIEDVGLLPYQKCLETLAKSDVLVIIQPGTKIQIPSKLYDYIALNRKILAITPLDGALAELMQKYQLGYVHDPSDCAGIGQTIAALHKEKMVSGLNAIDIEKLRIFDVESIAGTLEQHLIRIASQSS